MSKKDKVLCREMTDVYRELNRRLQMVQNFVSNIGPELGIVWAASGIRSDSLMINGQGSQDYEIDWALIEVRPNRVLANQVKFHIPASV